MRARKKQPMAVLALLQAHLVGFGPSQNGAEMAVGWGRVLFQLILSSLQNQRALLAITPPVPGT